jgi:hypothetical protein
MVKKVPRDAHDVPAGLKQAGRFLWDQTMASYTLRADELLLLEQACREADLIADIQDEMRFQSLTVSGSQGQDVANPLLSEIRQHRMLYGQLIGRLNLPDLDSSQVGGLRAVPNQQRDAVNSRWHKAYGAGS